MATDDIAVTTCAAPGIVTKIRGTDFRPPRSLRNPHVQSVLASSGLRRWLGGRRRAAIEQAATEHLLECGDGVRLQGFHNRQQVRAEARGLIVLLHGWEGSARSAYLLNTGARMLAEGFDVFRLNFRDHGDTHHLNPELFHSGRLDEVVGAVRAIGQQFAPVALALAGFSLGGNFALRVALRAPDAGITLAYALAVCPVISPAAGLFGLEAGPWLYKTYFLRKWRGSLRRKRDLFPEREWFSPEDMQGTLHQLTSALVRRHTDYVSLEDYLDVYSIAGDRLRNLSMAATILASADDPVIPIEDFRALQLPPQVELDIASHGGHCGFIDALSLRSFTDDYIAERMIAHVHPCRP